MGLRRIGATSLRMAELAETQGQHSMSPYISKYPSHTPTYTHIATQATVNDNKATEQMTTILRQEFPNEKIYSKFQPELSIRRGVAIESTEATEEIAIVAHESCVSKIDDCIVSHEH